jgi:hypothetical protein
LAASAQLTEQQDPRYWYVQGPPSRAFRAEYKCNLHLAPAATSYAKLLSARRSAVKHRHIGYSRSRVAPIRVAATGMVETIPTRFRRLADEWSREIGNVSSLTSMVSHPAYRQIIDMRWDVVPLLLADLQRNKRFWLPALHEITGIQPFDPSDAGNSKRMIDAWIRWGQNKYKHPIE